MSDPDPRADDILLGRLRQLSLVDLDALLAGSAGSEYEELLDAYAGDLEQALAQARTRITELVGTIGSGADPLGLLDAPPKTRARDGGREAADRIATQLAARSAACRALAKLDDASGPLIGRLLEADRRRQ